MPRCYVCTTEIGTDNFYREHILLNSIGGKLIGGEQKASSLICRKCAHDLDAIDAALSDQLNHIGLWLNIKRDRGTNPPVKATIVETGEEISLSGGGKPASVKPTINDYIIDDDKIHLSISARDRKQMREVLKGLKRKYSLTGLDVETTLQDAIPQRYYLTTPAHYEATTGGEKAFRAICKMAINFYIHSGGVRNFITHLIPYIKGEQQQNCVWYFYPDDFTAFNGEELQVFHTLYVKGDPSEGILFAHIDLFSTFKFFVLLSDQYNGEHLQCSYTFDVINRNEIEQNVVISLSKQEALELLERKPNFQQEIIRCYDDLLKALQIKQSNNVISSIVRETVEKHLKGVPKGTIFDRHMADAIEREISEKYVLFMHRHELGRENQEGKVYL